MWQLLTVLQGGQGSYSAGVVLRLAAFVFAAIAMPAQAGTVSPVCSSGFTFSRAQGLCIATVAPTCTKPDKWDQSRKGCYTVVAANCPSGYIFERGGLMCRPNNMTTASSTASVSPSCPLGYTLSGRSCRSNTSTSPVCASGYTFNSSSGMCQQSAQSTCPSGYRFDVARKVCSSGVVYQ